MINRFSAKAKISLLLVFVLVLGVSVFALVKNRSAQEATARETLNVLNWTSYVPDDVIADFEAETGVKVNYGTYSSNEELLAKVSSAAPGTYDLIFPSDYMVELMIARDMLAPLDTSRLSNLKNLNPKFLAQKYDPENAFSVPFLLATSVIVYDETKLAPIHGYRDLLRSELANSVVLLDDQRITLGALLQASNASMNSTSEADLSRALNFYAQLRPNVKAFDSDSPKTFLITGEVDAGIIWNAEAELAATEREGLKIVYPSEGFALSMDNYCLVKGGKNTDNAYKFIDFLLRDDISRRIVEEYPYISPNVSVASLPESELDEILTRGTYVENVGANIKLFDKLWAKIK
ncbi:spermidine/putrescine ABC transporter substrate-binding protein [Candidatus Saccharibacteria bacterium]|nr:spermidine/putrescine ABC transporter substrate-binding protein [Candidatus Saccharibacteria bacterium]